MFPKPKTKNTPPTKAPTLQFSLADESPDFASIKEKIFDLKAREQKLDNDESAALGKLNARPKKPIDNMNRNVAALLGDTVDEADPLVDGLQKHLHQVQAQRRDVKAARSIAEQRLAAARYAASRVICARVLPEYRTRVGTLANALIAAARADADLRELTDALDLADVAWSGPLRPVPATRLLGERGDKVGRWLKEAVAYELIQKSTIPSELAA